MKPRRMRRAASPPATLSVALIMALIVALLGAALALAGCRHTADRAAAPAAGDASAQGAGETSQAERTRAMEEKAREIERKAAEIQNMQGSEQEKIDAVNKLEQERQELNRMGGDSGAPAASPQQ